MSRTKKIIGISTALVVLLLILVIAFHSTRRLTDTVDDQLAALKNNNIEEAYSYTSADFRNNTSLKDFSRFVDQFPILKNYETVHFIDERSNGTGVVKGTLSVKSGASTDVEYHLIKEQGAWKIVSITVNPVDVSANQNKETIVALSDKNAFAQSKSPATLTELYNNKESRYSIKYSKDWNADEPGKGTVIFSGKKGTSAYYATVNIQTVLTKKTGGDFSTVKEFMQEVKKQAERQSPNVKFPQKGFISLTMPTGAKFSGEFVTFTYNYLGQTYKQWQIVVLRNDNLVFYTWAYTAPAREYDQDLPTAQTMLKTWFIY